jgi:hypothetical protein
VALVGQLSVLSSGREIYKIVPSNGNASRTLTASSSAPFNHALELCRLVQAASNSYVVRSGPPSLRPP